MASIGMSPIFGPISLITPIIIIVPTSPELQNDPG